MVLDTREVSVESWGILLYESHDASCDFGGKMLRCLRIFGRGFVWWEGVGRVRRCLLDGGSGSESGGNVERRHWIEFLLEPE
jgi:hypothetical protein